MVIIARKTEFSDLKQQTSEVEHEQRTRFEMGAGGKHLEVVLPVQGHVLSQLLHDVMRAQTAVLHKHQVLLGALQQVLQGRNSAVRAEEASIQINYIEMVHFKSAVYGMQSQILR